MNQLRSNYAPGVAHARNTQVGDLRRLGDIQGHLQMIVDDIDAVCTRVGRSAVGITGAVVEVAPDGGDYLAAWITGWSRPFQTGAVYERVI